MHRAALSILLDVPACTWRDAGELADLAATTLDPLPKAQQRRVAKRLTRYFAAMLAAQVRLDGPQQYVTTIQGDGMAPALSEGDQVVYERHRGKPIPGAYYIIAWRSRDGSKHTAVRRLSHITSTGRWAVELFNGTDGKPRLDYFSPKHWRLASRIVRHYSRKH